MDRKALSKRLEGLSSVFASGTPIATDLAAMAYTLDKMADDKFKDILAAGIAADKVVNDDEDKAAGECSNGCNCNNDAKAKEASSQGLYWSREASDVVLAGLVKDVTGAVLTKEQTPDGEKKAVKPATLKEEQTPSISKVLDSDIVTKSHGSVAKSASDEDEADGDAEGGDREAAKQDVVQPSAPQPGDIDGNETKTEKEVGSMEDMAQSESKNAFVSEGVELSAPMIEVSLGSKEAEDLSRLFS